MLKKFYVKLNASESEGTRTARNINRAHPSQHGGAVLVAARLNSAAALHRSMYDPSLYTALP